MAYLILLLKGELLGSHSLGLLWPDQEEVSLGVFNQVLGQDCFSSQEHAEAEQGKVQVTAVRYLWHDLRIFLHRSRSSSDERKKAKAKSPPGAPSLHYQVSYTDGILSVAVLECKNLKKTDTFGSTDGYVEVSLLPHKEKMDKTKTIKSSANPVWNQTFTYQVNIRSSNC